MRVQWAQDSADEDDETFTLALSNRSGATLGDAAATGWLEDDDESLPPLTASFQGVPAEHDDTTFTFREKFREDADVTRRGTARRCWRRACRWRCRRSGRGAS